MMGWEEQKQQRFRVSLPRSTHPWACALPRIALPCCKKEKENQVFKLMTWCFPMVVPGERKLLLKYRFTMIKAILVDDETHCLDTLHMLLAEHCPQVEVLQQCRSVHEALLAIEKHK